MNHKLLFGLKQPSQRGFGEYMPFGLDTITGFSNFSKGTAPKIIHLDNHMFSFVPLICYESIFARYLPETTQSSIILNLTNDSWFGETAGPYQHFDHMIFRSYQSRTASIRLSGNGMSAIILQNGKIVYLSSLNKIQTITNN